MEFSLPIHYTHVSHQVLKKTVIVSPVSEFFMCLQAGTSLSYPSKQRASWQEKQGEEASGAGACG